MEWWRWFWYFIAYSFLGFLIEWAYAKVTSGRPDRKCLLILPLCPVYGLGACASLLVAPLARGNPVTLFLLGTAACTAAEYAMAVWYERWVGTPFWDYSRCAGNLHGRICLPFSLAWGALILAAFYWIHPLLARAVSGIPPAVTAFMLTVALTDAVWSHLLLRSTGDRACLRWYETLVRGKKEGVSPH